MTLSRFLRLLYRDRLAYLWIAAGVVSVVGGAGYWFGRALGWWQ